jgi:O-antigen ligase
VRLAYTKISKVKILLLLVGPGFYAIQLLSRFAISSMDLRQFIDITYIFILCFFGLANFTIRNNSYIRWVAMFSVFSLLFNIASLVNGYTSLGQVLYSSISFILLPAFVAVIICRGPVAVLIENFLYYFVIPLLFINFVTAFVELNLREITSLSGLQITGRSYELIALTIASLLLASRASVVKTKMLFFAFFITVGMSFSRGAMLTFIMIFLQRLSPSKVQFFKWTGVVILVVFLSSWLGLLGEFINSNFGNLLEFWEKRLNIGEDFLLDTELDNMSSRRLDIYAYCWAGFSENPLFGVGIAQTQSYFLENYTNMAYSSCHNLFITPLLERGLIAAIGCWILVAVAVYKVFTCPASSGGIKSIFLLGVLLFYVSTTGAEFFIMSSSIRNANILIAIFLIIFVFSNRSKTC